MGHERLERIQEPMDPDDHLKLRVFYHWVLQPVANSALLSGGTGPLQAVLCQNHIRLVSNLLTLFATYMLRVQKI